MAHLDGPFCCDVHGEDETTRKYVKCPYCGDKVFDHYDEHVDECKTERIRRVELMISRSLTDDEKEQFFTNLVWNSKTTKE